MAEARALIADPQTAQQQGSRWRQVAWLVALEDRRNRLSLACPEGTVA